eukprot:5425516-Amphidinium_carterae.1
MAHATCGECNGRHETVRRFPRCLRPKAFAACSASTVYMTLGVGVSKGFAAGGFQLRRYYDARVAMGEVRILHESHYRQDQQIRRKFPSPSTDLNLCRSFSVDASSNISQVSAGLVLFLGAGTFNSSVQPV